MCHWVLMKQASVVYQFQSMDICGRGESDTGWKFVANWLK